MNIPLSTDAVINIIFIPKTEDIGAFLSFINSFEDDDTPFKFDSNEYSTSLTLDANLDTSVFVSSNFYNEVLNNICSSIFNKSLSQSYDINANEGISDDIANFVTDYKECANMNSSNSSYYSLNANESIEQNADDFLKITYKDKLGASAIDYGMVNNLFNFNSTDKPITVYPVGSIASDLVYNANDFNNRFGYTFNANESFSDYSKIDSSRVFNANEVTQTNSFLLNLTDEEIFTDPLLRDIKKYAMKKFNLIDESGEI